MRYTREMIGMTIQPDPKPSRIEVESTATGRYEPCSQCHGDNGQNQINGTGIQPCRDCDGTGWSSYSHGVKCSTCRGEGETTCWPCNGTGEVRVNG